MRNLKYSLVVIAIAILPITQAIASEIPDTGVHSIKSTGPGHISAATNISKILLNDGLKGYYPSGYSLQQFVERAAFYQAYGSTITDNSNWPDNYTTTPDFITGLGIGGATTVEHFMDPNSHGGVLWWHSAGEKCADYFENQGAIMDWQGGNVGASMAWLGRSMHFVTDLTIPSHGDPNFAGAIDYAWAGQLVQIGVAWARLENHQVAENEVCSRLLSWGEFEPYRNQYGKYYQVGTHGNGISAFCWVDTNSHLYARYRSICDNYGETFWGTNADDDWDFVAGAIAPSFWGSAAGFANYFCDRVSSPSAGPKCPIGLEAYPIAPAGFEIVSETATQITLKWTHAGGGTYPNNLKSFRVHYGPMSFSRPQGVTGYDYAVTVSASARQVTITLPSGHPYYHYAVCAVNGLGMESGYSYLRDRWYAETYGNNPYTNITTTPEAGNGLALAINSNGTQTVPQWLNGPVLRKEINNIFINTSSTVSWEQIDYAHALLFELVVQGTDGLDRSLIYAANASNHWNEPGYVNMGVGEEYNTMRSFTRNINNDYQLEYGKIAFKLQSLKISHYSYSGWGPGDYGGTVRNIVLPPSVVPPAAPSLSGIAVWVPLGKGVPGQGSGAYWAKLSWTCTAGQFPISKYEIQSKYSYYTNYTNRGYTTNNPWQEGSWTLSAGSITYQVRAIDNQGIAGPWSNAKTITQPDPGPGDPYELRTVKGRPEITLLMQNTPNPFRGQTAIAFQTTTAGNVDLTVYNVQGQLVKRLAYGPRESGYHSVQWDGCDDRGNKVPAGIYLYRLRASEYTSTKKVTVM